LCNHGNENDCLCNDWHLPNFLVTYNASLFVIVHDVHSFVYYSLVCSDYRSIHHQYILHMYYDILVLSNACKQGLFTKVNGYIEGQNMF
jgi:hypothetical protein